jgi:hypothetical protein
MPKTKLITLKQVRWLSKPTFVEAGHRHLEKARPPGTPSIDGHMMYVVPADLARVLGDITPALTDDISSVLLYYKKRT